MKLHTSGWGLTLFIFAVKQPTEVNKLFVGNVLIVDAHTLPLTTEEVCGVDGTSTAAIHCIKTFPVAPQLPSPAVKHDTQWDIVLL